MLIDSPRLTDEDRAAWVALSRRFRRPAWQVDQRARLAQGHLRRFLAKGPAHVAVSWGKDSITVAHLTRGMDVDVPLCWVLMDGLQEGAVNPDCLAVRDAFLDRWPSNYVEIHGAAEGNRWAWNVALGNVRKQLGDRRIMGIRATESGSRMLSAMVHGVATERVCRPILHWSTAEVFAYLLRHDLPIHPAYAMSRGGRLDIERLRVDFLGGETGNDQGRGAWERHYYRDCAPYSVPPPEVRP